jgi:hypothetical protein
MSYEIKLYIGLVQDGYELKEEAKYFSIISTYELSAIGNNISMKDIMKDNVTEVLIDAGLILVEKVFIYEGDNKIEEDKYGIKLFSFSARSILDKLKKIKINYRRLPPAIALLESMIEHYKGDKLQVILYGH